MQYMGLKELNSTFGCQNRRFKYHDPEQKARPSPAQYNVKDPIYFKSLASSTSPAFRLPLAGAPIQMGPHVTRSRWGLKPTPGPGSYDPIPKNYSRARLGVEENGASFVFKSQSKRGIQNPAIFVPPPGMQESICLWRGMIN